MEIKYYLNMIGKLFVSLFLIAMGIFLFQKRQIAIFWFVCLAYGVVWFVLSVRTIKQDLGKFSGTAAGKKMSFVFNEFFTDLSFVPLLFFVVWPECFAPNLLIIVAMFVSLFGARIYLWRSRLL